MESLTEMCERNKLDDEGLRVLMEAVLKKTDRKTYLRHNGDVYYGEACNDAPNGLGTISYANGDFYHGHFRCGKIEGFGVHVPSIGNEGGFYVGYFKNNLFDGHGQRIYSSGIRFVGTWKAGEMTHVRESVTYKRRTSTGESAVMTRVLQSGCLYRGQWLNGAANGPGMKIGRDGRFWWGIFEDGKLNGPCIVSGVLTSKSITRGFYIGSMKDGSVGGSGTIVSNDGFTYVGEFSNGKRHGFGENTWPDGGRHIGQYQAGMKAGRGTIKYANGDKFVGEFMDGWMNGQGKYEFAKGVFSLFEGIWVHNIFKRGIIKYANGDKYEGSCKALGIREGRGRMVENGVVCDGMWKDDEFIGVNASSCVISLTKSFNEFFESKERADNQEKLPSESCDNAVSRVSDRKLEEDNKAPDVGVSGAPGRRGKRKR